MARKGEPVHAWMGIADGLVKITDVIRSGKVVMFSGIPAGAWVGEGSVFKRELRRYDIVAVRQTRVIHVPRDVSRAARHRLRIRPVHHRAPERAPRPVHGDGRSRPDVRSDRQGGGRHRPALQPRALPRHGPVPAPVSQEEMGELAGLSRQRTNAAIQALAKAGLVRAAYGGLMVIDRPALRAYGSNS